MQLTLTKKIILGVSAVLLLGAVVQSLRNVGRNEGYAPDQPIPFSHKKHAGLYNIPCMYCHSAVEKSKHATIPSLNVCMNCHSVVAPDSPHIQKLKKLFSENKMPIEWIRIHDLPDHVNFNHKRHIAKGISCETCHGDVKNMVKIRQEKPLTMGWCLDCHRGNTAPASLVKTMKDIKPKDHPPMTGVAQTSCYTCHQ